MQSALVEQRTFPGETHAFSGMGKVVRGAYDAGTYAVARLGAAFWMCCGPPDPIQETIDEDRFPLAVAIAAVPAAGQAMAPAQYAAPLKAAAMKIVPVVERHIAMLKTM